MRQEHGLTLIELMITLAILAVLGTFGLSAFADTLARQRVHSALHLVSTDLAMARNTAIMRRQDVVTCPGDALLGCRADSDWSHGWIVFSDVDGNRRPDTPGDLLRVTSAPPGAPDSIRLAATRSFVRYQHDGRSAGTNLTIHVCRGGTLGGQVVVNNLGRVRSARPTGEPPCPR